MCRVLDSAYEHHQGAGACVVRINELLLTLSYDNGLSLPQAQALGEESAQCTAHRATWQNTGFNVEVGKRLATDDHNTRYYQCTLAGQFDGELTQFPVPDWAPDALNGIQLYDPFELQPHQWHDQEQLVFIRGLFNQIDIPEQ